MSIYKGQAFYFVFEQNMPRFVQTYVSGSDKILKRGHYFGYFFVVVALKTEVAGGEQTDQFAAFGDGNRGNSKTFHQFIGFIYKMMLRKMKRVFYHHIAC